MSNLKSNDEDPAVEDLVKSFKKLLNNASGDTETLNKFQDVLDDEKVRASSPNSSPSKSRGSDTLELFTTVDDPLALAESDTADSTELDGLKEFVTHITSFFNVDKLEDLRVPSELDSMYKSECCSKKYMWLTNADTPYHFGGRTYNPRNMDEFEGITNMMNSINSGLNLQLDSCLVVRYIAGNEALSLHQDNESILDPNHPIVVTSLGHPRTLEFWNSKHEASGKLVKKVTPTQGDLLVMNGGCQTSLWHKVLVNKSSDDSGLRYALSFRKLKPINVFEQKADTILTSTPLYDSKALPNGFKVHTNRVPTTLSGNLQPNCVPLDTAPSTPRRPPSVPPFHATQTANPPTSSQNPPPASLQPPQKHLVIGDSLVKGLRLPGSICICKGGIKPGELLQLLPESTDVLPTESYDNIRSVTVIVGTNALNVTRPGQGMPLLDVVNDYQKLVADLMLLFPNARVGLYNVLPRAHTCMETVYRIKDFNNIFQSHVATRMKNVFWINQYREFLDYRGFIREDLYGKMGIHLKGKGKGLMARCIQNFQKSFN